MWRESTYFRPAIAALLCSAALAGVSACGTSSPAGTSGSLQATSDPVLTAMRGSGAAKVAIAQLPPYAYLTPGGQPAGYLADVSSSVMKNLGVPRLVATVTTFDAMIPGLEAQQYDFASGGLNITSARCQVIIFSEPVTVQHDAVYVRAGNPKHLTGYASIARDPSVKAAVLAGSPQEAYALKQGVRQGQIVTVPDAQSGIAAVTGGRADTLVIGQFSVPASERKGIDSVVDTTSPLAGVGIAFRKSDVAFRDAFNGALDKLRANGTLQRLYAKYGFPNWSVLAATKKASDIAPSCA
jgi:polar amino acid transport system substrate-binding protein